MAMSVDARQDGSGTDGIVHTGKRSWWSAACRVVHASRVMTPFRSRAGRRRLVGLFLLVLAAFPILGWLTDQAWVVALNLVPYAIGSVLLGVATQGMLDRPVRSLDERQVHLRRGLFREPYHTGAVLGLAGGLVVAAAARLGDAPRLGLFLLVVGFVFGLPS